MLLTEEDRQWSERFYAGEFGAPAFCPFCHKGTPELARAGSGAVRLVCLRCGADGPPAETPEATLKLWNRCQSGGDLSQFQSADNHSLSLLERELDAVRKREKDLRIRISENEGKYAELRKCMANEYANVERVTDWLRMPRPATLAFTEGPERQLAYSIEARLYKA